MEIRKAIAIKSAISDTVLHQESISRQVFHFGDKSAALKSSNLLPLRANINGVGVSEKPDGESVIKILTRDRTPQNIASITKHFGIAKSDLIVEKVGRIHLRSGSEQRMGAGASCGHFRVTAGTIGCYVKDVDGKIYILSNNHVLANINKGHWDDAILHPGPMDGGKLSKNRVAGLAYYVQLETEAPNLCDAAIALVDKGISIDPLIGGKIKLKGTANPENKMKVEKFGRTTGYTTGSITTRNLDLKVDFDGMALEFHNQFEIKGRRKMFCDGGDSGALIVERETSRAVGLLFAGTDDGTTFASPIRQVLSSFSVKIM
jgi:hypothetical protein